jgi:hypothetical protein
MIPAVSTYILYLTRPVDHPELAYEEQYARPISALLTKA